ncbi:glycosyltransferase family 61 protein [Paracoccus amoyensis]|nr:glycosyltransferase family 61 protein [Paracoccus amoyensis]
MNIDPARFVPCGHVANKVITCAYLPDINPFYWSGDLSAFFRAMAARTFPMPRKEIRFYLSRQKSTRADSYEEQLQCELEKRGFLIIHAQELSVREQVELFASASCIIAPHGAGLANTIFCRSEVKVIEIFNTSIVSPDFCQRLKYVTRDYHPVVNLNDRAVGRVLDLIS